MSQSKNDLFNEFNKLELSLVTNEKVIGSGGFGTVYRSKIGGLIVANKMIYESKIELSIPEMKIMKKLRHPNVPIFYGCALDKKSGENRKVGIILEFIKGLNFSEYIQTLNNHFLKILHLIELANIVIYLHESNIIHRDLKPENIMIDEKNLSLKLLDYGISKENNRTEIDTAPVGTRRYMPPETYQLTDEDKSRITSKCDVWAFGCIAQVVICKEEPWDKLEQNQIVGQLLKSSNLIISSQVKDLKLRILIENCTKADPNERYNMRTVKERLLEYLVDILKLHREGNNTEILFSEFKPYQSKAYNNLENFIF